MKTERITCDACEKDITAMPETDGGYRLTLWGEYISSDEKRSTLLFHVPALKRSHHFCGVSCLKSWAATI